MRLASFNVAGHRPFGQHGRIVFAGVAAFGRKPDKSCGGLPIRRYAATRQFSPINFPPMPDTMHPHDANDIGYFLNHAIIAHADAPVVFCPGKFPAAGRSRVVSQGFDGFDDPVVNVVRQPAKVFFRRAFEEDFIHGAWWSCVRPDSRSMNGSATAGGGLV